MPSAIARVTDEALNAPPPAKPKPVSKRLRHAIDLLQRGECKDIKAAAERIGMARESLSRALRLPHVQVFIARSARETIALGALRASGRTIELMDAGSEHVSLDASKHVLAIAGIKPTADAQVSVNIDIKAGYVIDLTDDPRPMRDVTPTRSTGE
jgi:hypothetical protein